MEILNLKAKTRSIVGKKVKSLRAAGKVPGVVYGHGVEGQTIVLEYPALEKMFKAAGESTLIDLAIDEKPAVKVLIQDYQHDPVTNQFVHVDFHQINMNETLTAEIKLNFIGESPAVKGLGGTLVTVLNIVEVECLPKDLVHEIDVDLSVLATFDDVIHISDIKLPAGMTATHEGNDPVALVQEPRSEEDLASLDAKPEEVLPAEAAEKPAEDADAAKAE